MLCDGDVDVDPSDEEEELNEEEEEEEEDIAHFYAQADRADHGHLKGGHLTDETMADSASVLPGSTAAREKEAPTQSEDDLVLSFFADLPASSLELFNPEVLKHIFRIVERTPHRLPSLEVVGKQYEDSYLRPPDMAIGERPCVAGRHCICAHLGRHRFPAGDARIFVCTEFLLPTQRDAWVKSGVLPKENGKCLLCIRWWTHYLYTMARMDRRFRIRTSMTSIDASPPERLSGSSVQERTLLERLGAGGLPTHTNLADTKDGYLRDALLYSDEESVNAMAVRDGTASSLLWRPFVRFETAHYAFELCNGRPCVLQQGIGCHLNGGPSSGLADSTTASCGISAQ